MSYHLKLKSAIEDACKDIPKIHPYKYKQIKLNCATRNCDCVLKYEPDSCLAYKPLNHRTERLIIFEILDRQNEATTIADTVRIILSGNCRKAYFISPNKSKHAMAKRVLDTVISKFKVLLNVKTKKDVLDAYPILILRKAKKVEITNVLRAEIKKIVK